MASLSVVIPVLNEEKDLPNCLESLKDLNCEVIVVDSGSTDKTAEIARQYKAKVVSHNFKNFSDQRNFCDSLASGDWILSTEADVIVSKKLSQEIHSAITNTQYSAYYIERINIIWGKPIMHTNWGPKDDCHIWLYKKGSGKWQSDVHEEYISTGKVGKLKERLVHNNYETVCEFIGKIDKYSEIANKQGAKFPWFQYKIDFLKRYFYKLGFLDGYHGLFLSYLQSIYFITLSVKTKFKWK